MAMKNFFDGQNVRRGGLSRKRWWVIVFVVTAVIGAIAFESSRELIASHAAFNTAALKKFVGHHFITPWFPAFIALVLLLEIVKPASTRGGILSRGFVYDASIGFIIVTFQFIVVNFAMRVLFSVYAICHLPVVGRAIPHWNNWVLAAIGLVSGDFLSWASHLVRHKVPQLWRFHAMHHSQQDLNIFTEFRSHPFDSMASSVMQSLPLYVLQVPFSISIPCLVVYKYYLMFVHANVNIDLGWLGRILVSPKFHRIHHASAAELYDHNYGSVLSIWDGIFGTFKLVKEGQINTGAEGFPTEHDSKTSNAGALYVRQLIAPFERGIQGPDV